jgi:hypothetical protein
MCTLHQPQPQLQSRVVLAELQENWYRRIGLLLF